MGRMNERTRCERKDTTCCSLAKSITLHSQSRSVQFTGLTECARALSCSRLISGGASCQLPARDSDEQRQAAGSGQLSHCTVRIDQSCERRTRDLRTQTPSERSKLGFGQIKGSLAHFVVLSRSIQERVASHWAASTASGQTATRLIWRSTDRPSTTTTTEIGGRPSGSVTSQRAARRLTGRLTGSRAGTTND